VKEPFGYVNYKPIGLKMYAKKQSQLLRFDIRDNSYAFEAGDIVEFEVVRKKDRLAAVSVVKIR
jgi:hypothetical protein